MPGRLGASEVFFRVRVDARPGLAAELLLKDTPRIWALYTAHTIVNESEVRPRKQFLIASKSKHSLNNFKWSSTQSKTSTMRSPIKYTPAFVRSIAGTFSHILISLMLAVCDTILSVIFSGAGPPFS